MTPDVIKILSEREQPSEGFHADLLSTVKRLVKMSRQDMSEYYADWDLQDRVYRGEMCPDIEDRKQALKGKPVKMVVPNTFAQVMTFTSFLFLMFKQNRTFFELNPTGDEDAGKKREDSELLLERDLRKNEWDIKLYQHLLDVSRFGTGILETCWTKESTRAYITPPDANVLGVSMPQSATWQEFTKFEGNLIRNVSPYRFFPDTRFPLVDFKRGEFCAAEEEYAMSKLYDMEAAGEVAGVKFIEPLSRQLQKDRGATRSAVTLDLDQKFRKEFDASKSSSVALVTKVQIWIVPSQFKVSPNEKPLGPEEFPLLYHVWYANDNRIIRVEPAYWWHNEFSWSVAQFTPDMHQTLTMGLADLIYRLQDVISWLVNSHITSVRRVMQNRLVINSQFIDTKTLDGEGDVYLRKGVNVPLDRAFAQMRVQDVTAAHMSDADLLGKIMEMVTGVNGNAMGQYNSGRRSAQEARVVTAGAAGRMKMHGHLIWESSLSRLARQMHSNLRQSLSFESFQRAVGSGKANPLTGMTAEQDIQMRYAAYKGTPEEVICGDDFFIFDSTLASEKGFIAQSLQELLMAIMSNPVAAQQMDISPQAMLEEIQYLRGAGSISRFSLSSRVAQNKEAAPPPVALPSAQPA